MIEGVWILDGLTLLLFESPSKGGNLVQYDGFTRGPS